MMYHVTCNTDNNYVQHCCAMLCSLFENNKDLDFHVHILTNGLSKEMQDYLHNLINRYNSILSIYHVDESKLEGVKFRKNRPLTKAAYYRVLLPEILDENIDKVLYLDCDIVVLHSVSEIYHLELSDYALAACPDASPYNDLHRRQLDLSLTDKAFCSGVMMINLKYWRDHHSSEKLLEYSKRKREFVFLHDQDSLNYVFKNQWYVLPYKWGKSPLSIAVIDSNQRPSDITEYVYEPRILHYASDLKPWINVWTPFRKYYLKYLALSGFPNPKFKTIGRTRILTAWIANIRYLVNRYLRPLVPYSLEIVLMDIFCILKFIITVLLRPKSLNRVLLDLWLRKYKI